MTRVGSSADNTSLPPVVRTVADLRQQVARWRQSGLRVGLVPTMGALHHGHLSLVQQISTDVDRVVVSIFVNPKQFNEASDLDAYPRQEDADRKALASVPADLVYAPTATEMYAQNFNSVIHVGGLTETLEGINRPGHFDGVTTVVLKLFMQCQPDLAIFGEKDFQQLRVIEKMTADLDLPVAIIPGALVREPDGLAASSRNSRLSDAERAIAPALYRTLCQTRDAIVTGSDPAVACQQAVQSLVAAGFTSVDYVSLHDSQTLKEVTGLTRPARLLAVARLGDTRLLDNLAVDPA